VRSFHNNDFEQNERSYNKKKSSLNIFRPALDINTAFIIEILYKMFVFLQLKNYVLIYVLILD
jgi:hypothetical protein